MAQSGDFLLAQGAGKYREPADVSGKGVAHGSRRIEARMAEYPLAPTSTLKPQSNPSSQLYADTREGRYRVGGNF